MTYQYGSKFDLDRRALLTLLSGSVLANACRTVAGATSNPATLVQTEHLVIRRRWVPGEKAAYKDQYIKAVGLLKANDANFKGSPESNLKNPEFFLSWKGLVAVHEKSCQHKNWYLLPYHRLYLMYFEAACQTVLGDANFGLPYWDWSQDFAIPDEFYDVEALKSDRDLKKGQRLPESSVNKKVIDSILASGDFINFHSGPLNPLGPQDVEGNLERTPHDTVHNTVGGLMGHPTKSPTDPIFWLHHGNIDRLWSIWINAHPESIASQLALSPTERKADPRRKFSWGDSPISLDLHRSNPSGWEGYEDILLAMLMQKLGGGTGGIPGGFPDGGLGGFPGVPGGIGGFPGSIIGGPGVFAALPGPAKPQATSPEEIAKQAELVMMEQLKKIPVPPLASGSNNRMAEASVSVKDLVALDKLPYLYDTDADTASPIISTAIKDPTRFAVKARTDVFVKGTIQIEASRVVSALTLSSAQLQKLGSDDESFARLTYFNIPVPENEAIRLSTTILYFVVETDKVKALPDITAKSVEAPEYVGSQNFFLTHKHGLFTDHSKVAGVIDVTTKVRDKASLTLIAVAVNRKTFAPVNVFDSKAESGLGLWLSYPT